MKPLANIALAFACAAVSNPESLEDDMSALIDKSFKMAKEFQRQAAQWANEEAQTKEAD